VITLTAHPGAALPLRDVDPKAKAAFDRVAAPVREDETERAGHVAHNQHRTSATSSLHRELCIVK
jgi:hypothetical protein